MINRELTVREKEILGMIRPTTFRDIVDVVRKDVEQSRYDAKRELRYLHNGVANEITNEITRDITNGAANGVTNGVTNGATNGATNGIAGKTNGRNRINNIGREICEVLI